MAEPPREVEAKDANEALPAAPAELAIAAAAAVARPVLRILPLREGAIVPSYQSEQAAGLDLHACLQEPRVLAPGDIAMIPCGFAMAVPVGFEAQVRPRSGLASKFGISMPNAPGTIDADYRGEVMVPLINLGRRSFTIEPGMRFAQMVIAPIAHARVRRVASLEETDRGSGGFGSTGV
ncbi:MAG: dUTP diphosphatase [Phycisphaerales bacterium JB038]